MIRNLKTLLLAAMAVMAFSALLASAAQAAPQFTNPQGGNTTLTAEPDEAAGTTTAHHVFDVPGNGSITCNQITFDTTVSGNPVPSITVDPTWDVCKFLGQTATVNMHGCDFTFFPEGKVLIQNKVGQECATQPITFAIPTCTVRIGPQTLTGIKYHHRSAGSATLTVEALIKGVKGEALAGCPVPGAFTTGEYTTGNAIIKGEDPITNAEKVITWDA